MIKLNRKGLIACLLLAQGLWAAEAEPLFQSTLDGAGNPLSYPLDSQAELTAAIVTLQPGESTGWHLHEVPTFGYLLQGELTVEYAAGEQRVFRAGDGIIEAQHSPHQGHNLGSDPVRILVFHAGASGVPNTEAVTGR
jgi:quercetin dioxygenase-like cupin family protein